MTALLDPILAVPPWAVLLLVGLFVFAEDALFIGFVVPGETAAILGGVAASRGHVSLPLMVAVVVAAAVVGDSVGYEVGRTLGPRLLRSGPLAGRRERIDRARAYLARRGGAAVFLARSVAFLRAVMPALAGSARMPYRVFLAWNVAGGLVWGVASVVGGYLAGESYLTLEKYAGRGAAAVVGLLVVGALLWWYLRRRRDRRASVTDRTAT